MKLIKEAKENKIILNDAQKKKVLDYLYGEFDLYTFYKDKLDKEWYITDDKSLDPIKSDSDDEAFPMVLVIDGEFVDSLTRKFADEITSLKESVQLNEGTSNFWTQEGLPLYAFLTTDEVADRVRERIYSDDEYDEDNEDSYYELEDKYYDDLYKDGYAVISLDDGELEDAIDKFNDRTRELSYEAYDKYDDLERAWQDGRDKLSDAELDKIREEANQWYDASDYLEGMKLKIKDGYYEGAQLYLDGWNKYAIAALPEEAKKDIVDRYNKIGKDFGLMKLGVAWRASNGETGYDLIKEATTPEQREKQRKKIQGNNDKYTLTLMNQFNYTVKQALVDPEKKRIYIGHFNYGDGKGSFFHNAKEFQRHIDDLKAQGYEQVLALGNAMRDIDVSKPEQMDESYSKQDLINAVQDAYGFTKAQALKWISKASEEAKQAIVDGFKQNAKRNFYDESMSLTEKKWNLTIPQDISSKLRRAIDEEDYETLRATMKAMYKAAYDHFGGFVFDEDEFKEYIEEIDAASDDEEEFNYLLDQLYDFCDNIAIFIPFEESGDDEEEWHFEESLKEDWRDGLYEGKEYSYKDLNFYLLWLDSMGDEKEGYAILVYDYDGAVGEEDCIGFVDTDATDEDVMKVIEDNYDNFYNSIKDDPNFRRADESLKEDTNENGNLTIDLNTGVVRFIDAGQYNSWIELPDEAYWEDDDEKTSQNNKEWDRWILECAKPYIEECLDETSSEIKLVGELKYYHPKYYNYSTDEIEFTVSLTQDLLNSLVDEYINKPEFVQFLKSSYKSYDGYWSWMADNVKDFVEQADWKKLASILTFNSKDGFDKRQRTFAYEVLEGVGSGGADLILHWDDDEDMDESLKEDAKAPRALVKVGPALPRNWVIAKFGNKFALMSGREFDKAKEDPEKWFGEMMIELFPSKKELIKAFKREPAYKSIFDGIEVNESLKESKQVSYTVGGYEGKDDPMAKKDIRKASLYDVDADMEQLDDGSWELVITGDVDKVKDYVDNYLGLDSTGLTESLEGKDRKKFITLLVNELQKEPFSYSKDEALGIAIKRADALGKNPYDSIEALVKSEVSKTRSKKDESLKESVDDTKALIDFLNSLKLDDEVEEKVIGDWTVNAWTTEPGLNFSRGFYIVQIDNDKLNKHFSISDCLSQKGFEYERARVIKNRLGKSLKEGYFDTDFDNKKVRNEIVGWWDDVERWNEENGSPYSIDNGDKEHATASEVDEMLTAMWDMLVALRDEQKGNEEARALLKRGKRIYNKYDGLSWFTESKNLKESKEDIDVDAWVLDKIAYMNAPLATVAYGFDSSSWEDDMETRLVGGDTKPLELVVAKWDDPDHPNRMIKLKSYPIKNGMTMRELEAQLKGDKEPIKESKELDRQAFVSLVKLGDNSYDGYSILNDGNFVERIYAESDDDAIKQFRDWLDKGGTNLKESKEEDLTADEIAYKKYQDGEYTYQDYVDVCTQEECEPLPEIKESIEDKEDEKVDVYILMDDKYNWLEERIDTEEWAQDIHSDAEAIEYFKNSNPKVKYVAKMVYLYDKEHNFDELEDEFDFFKVREDEKVEEKKETAKDRVLAKRALKKEAFDYSTLKQPAEPDFKHYGNWVWDEDAWDYYDDVTYEYSDEIRRTSELPSFGTEDEAHSWAILDESVDWTAEELLDIVDQLHKYGYATTTNKAIADAYAKNENPYRTFMVTPDEDEDGNWRIEVTWKDTNDDLDPVDFDEAFLKA